MGTLSKCLLLFSLNWVDAQLTLVWVKLNIADEGNALMARVLAYGDVPFLGLKFAVGAFAAYVLYRCSHLPLARRGLTAVLAIYIGWMVIHAATRCLALGWHGPVNALAYAGSLPGALVSLFV